MSRVCGLTGLHHSVRYYRARRPQLRLQVPGKLGDELGHSLSQVVMKPTKTIT